MRKSSPPESIGAILDSLLAEAGYLNVCKEHDVVHRWPQIVGQQLAAVTECSRAEDGVLYVRVPSASWRHEIGYLKHNILSKIKEETRCTTIREIVLY